MGQIVHYSPSLGNEHPLTHNALVSLLLLSVEETSSSFISILGSSCSSSYSTFDKIMVFILEMTERDCL